MILCCGHVWRGDDAAGIEAGLRLRALGLDVTILERDAFALLDAWEGADDVVLIDAVSSGRKPGTVTVWEVDPGICLEEPRSISTHSSGVADAVALAAALGRLPQRVLLYGIEAGSIEPRAGISDAVRAGIEKVVLELAAARPARD